MDEQTSTYKLISFLNMSPTAEFNKWWLSIAVDNCTLINVIDIKTKLIAISWQNIILPISQGSICKTSGKTRKPICIGENKDADQLSGNREADQRLSGFPRKV